jgi:phospholipid-translocating ATPase
MGSFLITTWGWFAWLCFLDAVYAPGPDGPYVIRRAFTQGFGIDAVWWATVFIVLAFLGLMELVGKSIKRNMMVAGVWHWPPWKMHRLSDNVEDWDLEMWQEMERNPKVRERLRRLANNDETLADTEEAEEEDEGMFNVEARVNG